MWVNIVVGHSAHSRITSRAWYLISKNPTIALHSLGVAPLSSFRAQRIYRVHRGRLQRSVANRDERDQESDP